MDRPTRRRLSSTCNLLYCVTVTNEIHMHDVVALTEDVPATHFITHRPLQLRRGQVGTVVMTLDENSFSGGILGSRRPCLCDAAVKRQSIDDSARTARSDAGLKSFGGIEETGNAQNDRKLMWCWHFHSRSCPSAETSGADSLEFASESRRALFSRLSF